MNAVIPLHVRIVREIRVSGNNAVSSADFDQSPRRRLSDARFKTWDMRRVHADARSTFSRRILSGHLVSVCVFSSEHENDFLTTNNPVNSRLTLTMG